MQRATAIAAETLVAGSAAGKAAVKLGVSGLGGGALEYYCVEAVEGYGLGGVVGEDVLEG